VQMDGVCSITMVDKTDNGFNALGHHESWPGRDSIVSNEACFGQIRVDLCQERLDFNLIVLNGLSSVVVGEDTVQVW
jgi:hypothetical protein